jgi:hypothetical protein
MLNEHSIAGVKGAKDSIIEIKEIIIKREIIILLPIFRL